MTVESIPLLSARGLTVEYPGQGRRGRKAATPPALDSWDLDLRRGELVALVGESGAGKSTAGRAVLGLIDHARGEVRLDGEDVLGVSRGAWRRMRRRMQMIFQDPYDSLDPRATVEAILAEPLAIHRTVGGADRTATILDRLTRVGLNPAEHYLGRRTYELSGGQRQRVAIAAALMLEPELLVADEPVSMLDVSVRVGVLGLLRGLADAGMGILLVTHDLPTASYFADRVVVMNQGRIVESGPTASVLQSPAEAYTRALLAAVPGSRVPGRRDGEAQSVGEPGPASVLAPGVAR
jgi:peptide/nickel transport system ATP-binding protein